MAAVVRSALLKRLHDNHRVTRALEDLHLLTGNRVQFLERTSLNGVAGDPNVRSACVMAGHCKLGFLVAELHPGEPPARADALTRMLQLTAEALGREVMESGRHPVEALPGAVSRAAAILRQRYQEPLTLEEVAGEVGLSRERLSRLFHASTGITFSDYLNLVRLDHCRQLLKTGRKRMAAIAFECGYQSLSQFNRRFKAAEGISPSDYGKRYCSHATTAP